MTASNSLLAKKRCIVRDANFEKLDQACHVWFYNNAQMVLHFQEHY